MYTAKYALTQYWVVRSTSFLGTGMRMTPNE